MKEKEQRLNFERYNMSTKSAVGVYLVIVWNPHNHKMIDEFIDPIYIMSWWSLISRPSRNHKVVL